MFFWRYSAITLKISIRFHTKKLRCELSSSFDIILDSKEGCFLCLQIAVVLQLKKNNESKRKHQVLEFTAKEKKKDHLTIYQEMKIADRESSLVKV